ncbi:acetyltransferase [Halomonas cupida]|uniref:Acetyltransferase n=1 Tax=Halomonas cupida TaxID=44933 RepID=A0A1M7LCZ0_9GAMM|nr:GNAT family N-acetyltransferase [Halomonas cupida]GEN25223.1 acetyltransferase [Halomonas cupida]SHM75789.1 ElaA protein [Halomonas cupida]
MYQWQWKRFEELSLDELYEILRVRQEVFTVEQNCVYQDVDGLDRVAWHLLLQHEGSGGCTDIQGYLRIVYPGHKYSEPSIGRVMTTGAARGRGVGRLLMEKALAFLASEAPGLPIRISAQQYLETFYAEFGFETVSEPYAEDGIAHIEMLTRS